MKKEINYGGYSANRSDYESEDGELAVSMGLVNEEGQLRHVLEPKKLALMPDGCEIVFIHKTATYTHYIIKRERRVTPAVGRPYMLNEYKWINESEISEATRLPVEDIDTLWNDVCSLEPNVKGYEVNAVGNTLVVLAADGVHYVLWKNDGYTYLGQKPPMVELQFGLSELKSADYSMDEVDYIEGRNRSAWGTYHAERHGVFDIDNDEGKVRVNTEHQQDLNTAVWALINRTNALIQDQGHFYAPFFVRYCYRMYDGSMMMHSAPIWMPVSMDSTYRIFFINLRRTVANGHISFNPETITAQSDIYIKEENGTNALVRISAGSLTNIRYMPNNVALKCKALNTTALTSLSDTWGDIVKSIDVFVSAPVIREQTETIKTGKATGTYSILRSNNVSTLVPGQDYDINGVYFDNDILAEFPMLSDEAYLSKIQSAGQFYKVHSYNLEEGATELNTYHEVQIDGYVLKTLATQEVMKDDYDSHNLILPLVANGDNKTFLNNYNNRLNIAAINERLFEGFNIHTMVPSCTTDGVTVRAVYVFLQTEQGERAVRCQVGDNIFVSRQMLYNCPLFYPDSRAIRMEVAITIGGAPLRLVFPMQEHTMLNGAITKGNLLSSLSFTFTTDDSDDSTIELSDIMTYPNKLYTSEVENPFVFPVEGINTVGTGQILGISTAAKALSQGQFGQFPLYAFTTDGVWALRVTDTGTYNAVQPVTRDVLLDHESICQIDTAVLFATDRGVMVISGSESRCLSDVLLSEENFDPSTLPHLGGLLPTGYPTEIAPFREFVHGCRMVYDYIHQRIVVFNPTLEGQDNHGKYPYGYVFSLKSKLWGMTPTDLRTPLNSYPEALALTQDGYLVTLADSLEGADNNHPVQDALLVTRPLKLGDGNVFKSVHILVQRGMFHRGNVRSILYASRDLWHWHLIGSSVDEWIRGLRGSGYKYFRIAVLAKLSKSESVSGATVEYEPRELNRIH